MPDTDQYAGLLEAAVQDYVDALNTIEVFRREVWHRCRSLMNKHRAAYGNVLGVSLEADQIRNYEQAWNGSQAALGVKFCDFRHACERNERLPIIWSSRYASPIGIQGG